MPSSRRGGRDADGDAAFVQQLSEANAGAGCGPPGGGRAHAAPGALLVRRAGLTLRAEPQDCRTRDDRPPEARAAVLVRFPKELRRLSPGFYMALGDTALSLEDPVVRLYWNVAAGGAVPFMAVGTHALNASGLAGRLKVVNDPGGFDRCDTAVLYLRRDDFGRAGRLIAELRSEVAPWLREGSPAFTKPLAPGLSVADDPGGGESFGLSRCALIAEGVLRAYERGDPAAATVRATLAERGVDPRAPFLAPGRTDAYVLD